MDRTKNYYNILKLDKNCTKEDIKKSYRKLSFTLHPDKGGDEIEFNEIREAYNILFNDESKLQYDKISIYGLEFDETSLFNEFEYSDDYKSWDENKYQKFKNEEELHIVHYIDETFDGTIVYNRYVICKSCKGSGKDTDSKIVIKDSNGKIIKTFEGDDGCDFCEGTGKDWNDNDCAFCFGKGKVGSTECMTCKGEKRILGRQKLNGIEMSIDENEKCVEFMGHMSKNIPGKTGHLWIIRK